VLNRQILGPLIIHAGGKNSKTKSRVVNSDTE